MDENVKRNFKKLLEYQRKDIELRKINNLIERDEALASMNVNKRIFNDAKQTIAECEQQAGSLLSIYTDIIKYIEENEAAFAEIESAEAVSEEDIEKRVKKLDGLKSKFSVADKKLHDFDDKSKSECSRRKAAVESGKTAKAKFADARDKHTALVNSKAAEINRLKAELAAMQKALDPDQFAEYTELVADNRFPPVVPAVGEDKKNIFNCGGCGLNLSQKGNAMLNNQGWFHCENCRRIIVKLD